MQVKQPKLLNMISNNVYRKLFNASYYDDDNLLKDRHLVSIVYEIVSESKDI